jgi:AraC family transcriptional regulator of adaptative response / DNA-3-methyladenine glycosylase II
MLADLRVRAIPGLEIVDDARYQRTFREDGAHGTVAVVHARRLDSLVATIRCSEVRVLPRVVERIRRVFDLGADIGVIGGLLARDPVLAPLVAARPGLRVPGGWDGFEVGARAILGQQVSLTAARHLLSRLTERCGAHMPDGHSLFRVFPTPEQVVRADLSRLGVPGARVAALGALARAAIVDPLLFQPLGAVEDTVARLRFIPGVGAWTAEVIALRAAREPDAFPVGDAGLRRAFGALFPAATDPRGVALARRAEGWRPWRAYAAQHLWAADRTPLVWPKENRHVTKA